MCNHTVPSLYPQDFIRRFWAKVYIPDLFSCWEWTSSKTSAGYGHLWFSSKLLYAHRISWELANGPIPKGLYICHTCDCPACVSPAHLFSGTQADNMADMIGKGRDNHPGQKGEENGQAKLTSDQVQEIRQLRAEGMSQREAARRFCVSPRLVFSITHRKAWKHVP